MNNADLIERMKPCDICERPIGVQAMIKQGESRYHARCLQAETREKEERVLDGEDAEEWMRRSDIDQQGEDPTSLI